jgi:T-complex protein 1 subunit alpha
MASELLKRANELIKNKVHPTQVMTGFKKAAREACDYITVHFNPISNTPS